MQFELDRVLTDEILFFMENQDGDYLLDTREGQVIPVDNYDDEGDFEDNERFISLPDWSPHDGYRLMEHFAAGLKNPVVRQELSSALNRNKGVFRAYKNVLEQYPETEKLWFKFKEQEMKNEIIAWYNSLREEWGLQPIGSEPEDNSSVVLEDFTFREGSDSDAENAAYLHKLCIEEIKSENEREIFEKSNPFVFPSALAADNPCIIAESANADFAGFICAENKPSHLRIHQLEVKPEYRGMGLGKTLLAKLMEKCGDQIITIELPAAAEYFSRSLHLEGFKPCIQKYIRTPQTKD